MLGQRAQASPRVRPDPHVHPGKHNFISYLHNPEMELRNYLDRIIGQLGKFSQQILSIV